jgi:transcriptional regulator with XRE-family HTH domain
MHLFAERLKLLRELSGLTQTQAAEKLNIHRVNYNRYEKGERAPDQDTLIRIAQFFNTTADYLLGISNERRPGAGVLPIDNPEVLAFMQSVTSQFRLAPNLTDKERQEILEDLAEYFKFQLQKRKK